MRVLFGTLAAVLIAALVLWRPWEVPPKYVVVPTSEEEKLSGTNADPPPRIPPPSPTNAALPPIPADPVLSPADLQRIRDAIDNLELTFRDYATGLGGNPVGTNPEITAALLGDNAKQLKLDLPRDSTRNASGELCDPWGTPWFFHQLSAKKMEIRSAGPDRVLYTEDDFVR